MEDYDFLEIEGFARLYLPKSTSFLYYDGYYLIHHEAGPFESDADTEKNLSHKVAFAALAAAEWRKQCKGRDCQCQCTCTYCVLAQAWQEYFNEMSKKLAEKMASRDRLSTEENSL